MITLPLVVLVFFSHISAEFAGDTVDGVKLRHLNSVDDAPWADEDGLALSRHRRSTNSSSGDKSIWEEIEDFYSDKNNMAMFCVLPIMVLIYGGCSAIYCVHKCRQYLRRRKHKRLKEDDLESLNSDKNDLNQDETKRTNNEDGDRPISQISQAWTDLAPDGTDSVQWSGHTSVAQTSSPLPWQVTADGDADVAATAAAASALGQQNSERQRTNMSRASYVNDRLKEDITMTSSSRGHEINSRASSRASVLQDRLLEEEFKEDSRRNHNENLKIVAGATAASTAAAAFGESTDDQPQPHHHHHQQQQQQQHSRRRAGDEVSEESRTVANLTDYATNRSSKAKATDYSRFTDSKPIEIVPLSADPSLRVWDPLHKRPWGERSQSRSTPKIEPIGEAAHHGGGNAKAMKEEMLARYDALSTFQMAKKAAEILKTNAVEKNPFQRKPNKKKHIFIAE